MMVKLHYPRNRQPRSMYCRCAIIRVNVQTSVTLRQFGKHSGRQKKVRPAVQHMHGVELHHNDTAALHELVRHIKQVLVFVTLNIHLQQQL